MDDFIFNHRAVQKSMGDVIMWGLRKPNYKVKVGLVPERDEHQNEVHKPSPGEYSVRDMLCNIWMDEEQVIQSIMPGYDGTMRAFFLDCEALEQMAVSIGEDPASFIKIYALKRGWTINCCARLIRHSFTPKLRARQAMQTGIQRRGG